MVIVEVPYKQLESDTLKTFIETFIIREGTDYGEVKMALDQKIDLVTEQIKAGEAVLMWDTDLQSSNIVLKEDADRSNAANQPLDTNPTKIT